MARTYLALDPGETTGWALFNMQGIPIEMGYVQYQELFYFLESSTPGFFVVEEFMLVDKDTAIRNKINHYTRKWDKVYAARAIGAIEYRADILGIPIHFQRSSILTSASQAFGLSLTKFKKAQHPVDAVLHGAYYAWKELGILPPERSLELHEEQERSTLVIPLDSYSGLKKAFKKTN